MPLLYVIEDDSGIRHLLTIALENCGYTVKGFETAEEALLSMEQTPPDLCLFDIMLPGMDGVEAVRRMRSAPGLMQIPVMMLTAKDTELDKVVGLDSGADDYMTKPFGVMELTARVRSLLRRAQMPASGGKTRLVCEDLVLDPATHTVTVEGRPVELTHKEYSLLQCLMENSNRVMERSELLSTVWGYENLETRTLDIHIQSLRKKLGKAGEGHIKTVRGVGYRFISGGQA